MGQEAAIKPKLSVIVPALLGYDTVLAALDAWEAQSCRAQLEILVLCPTAPAGPLPAGQLVIVTGSLHLHQARCLAILQASADYVVLAEDHCLPDKFWTQAILDRLAEGWDAIGPALRSGNPTTKWTQASFLLGYGQWMSPVPGGPATVLPGHNAVLRRQPLLELGGPALEEELLVAAFLLRRLGSQAQRFFLEDRATMRHFDLPGWKRCLPIFCCVGLGFGALRTRHWPRAGRILYWAATPAIAARHWMRALTHYRRAGSQARLAPFCLVAALPLALAWACGEAAGALLGIARVTPFLSYGEIKPVARTDV